MGKEYGIVYLAISSVDGKVYVGVTKRSLEKRIVEHVRNAVKGSKYRFHRALQESGMENFSWTILCKCADRSELIDAERFFVSLYGSSDPQKGFNSTPGGFSRVERVYGKLLSAHREKISKTMKGRKFSDEHKRNLSERAKQRWENPEERLRVSDDRKGMRFSDEHRKNLSLANVGKKLSEETRKKMSIAHLKNHSEALRA